MKKSFSMIMILALTVSTIFSLTSCGEQKEVLRVYNWGEYIDESVIEEFEKETGIEVVYDMFNTNEEMYPRIEADSSLYDVICPSEYMAEKMIGNGLVQKLDKSKLSNWNNTDPVYLQILSDSIDPGNEYFVPYMGGTVGILYNTKLVDEAPDSWDVLFDEKYSGSILMMDSVRDAMMIACKKLGYSTNTTDENEIAECEKLLESQYPLVKDYVIDEVRDKMIAGDTALGVIYSGEYMYCSEQNEDLAYVVPKEGSNVWYDGWVITKDAKNPDAAHKWLDFLLRPDIAAKNFDCITYTSPNKAAYELIDEAYLNDPGVFPDEEVLKRCEVYKYLGEDVENMYYEYWKKVK